jgi:DNA-binding GntR family transcriptional regulator
VASTTINVATGAHRRAIKPNVPAASAVRATASDNAEYWAARFQLTDAFHLEILGLCGVRYLLWAERR